MRALHIALIAVVTLAGAHAAHAQRPSPGGKGAQGEDNPVKAQKEAEERKRKDNAYEDALRRIPASTEKQDPWEERTLVCFSHDLIRKPLHTFRNQASLRMI